MVHMSDWIVKQCRRTVLIYTRTTLCWDEDRIPAEFGAGASMPDRYPIARMQRRLTRRAAAMTITSVVHADDVGEFACDYRNGSIRIFACWPPCSSVSKARATPSKPRLAGGERECLGRQAVDTATYPTYVGTHFPLGSCWVTFENSGSDHLIVIEAAFVLFRRPIAPELHPQ